MYIEIKLNDKTNVICGVVYVPPTKSDTTQQFLTNMSSILCKLKNEKKPAYAMGDFNRDMLSPDKLTNEFMDKFFSKEFFPLIDKPTRIYSLTTLLDTIWTNNLTCEITSAIVTIVIEVL